MPTLHQTLTEQEELARRVAGELLCDVRTVRRFLRGESVRGLLGQRLSAAVARLRAGSTSHSPPASTAA